MRGLVPLMGVRRQFPGVPQEGGRRTVRREVSMKLVRRITIALASIAALALAGGAHWRAG
jgi:hypothetical protein